MVGEWCIAAGGATGSCRCCVLAWPHGEDRQEGFAQPQPFPSGAAWLRGTGERSPGALEPSSANTDRENPRARPLTKSLQRCRDCELSGEDHTFHHGPVNGFSTAAEEKCSPSYGPCG